MKTGYGLGCPTCRGGVPFYIKNKVEAHCQNCDDFIGLSGTFVEILAYNETKNARKNTSNNSKGRIPTYSVDSK